MLRIEMYFARDQLKLIPQEVKWSTKHGAVSFSFTFSFSSWVLLFFDFVSLPTGQFNYISFFRADALRKSIFLQFWFSMFTRLLHSFSSSLQRTLWCSARFNQANRNNWQVIYNKEGLIHIRTENAYARQNSNWTEAQRNFDEQMIDSL